MKPSESPSTDQPSPTTQPPWTTTTRPVRIIEVIERGGWEAAEAHEGMVEHTIERLTIHHTGVELEDNRLAPSRLRAHQRFHQTDRAWPDLAYHFAIDREGNIYEGRSPEFRGDTATGYDPTGHFLVVLEGNFDVESLPEPPLSILVDLLAWGARWYEVSPESIKGHRDYVQTSCPGTSVYDLVRSGALTIAVEARLREVGLDLVYLRGEEAIERVNSIEAGR